MIELILQSYSPKITQDVLFHVDGMVYTLDEQELSKSIDEIVQTHGYPVKLMYPEHQENPDNPVKLYEVEGFLYYQEFMDLIFNEKDGHLRFDEIICHLINEDTVNEILSCVCLGKVIYQEKNIVVIY